MSEIRLARTEEFAAVYAFYDDLIATCAADPCFPPWEMGVHPTEIMLKTAIAAQTLYISRADGKIRAAMVLNDDVPVGYANGVWLEELADSEYLVLHLLAVSPECRRMGLAKSMVRHALSDTQAFGKRSLRLDAWAQNKPAHALYRSLGFVDAGMMRETCDDGSFLDFWLFEYPFSEGNT